MVLKWFTCHFRPVSPKSLPGEHRFFSAETIDNGDVFPSTDRLAEKSVYRQAPRERNTLNINTA